MTKENKKTLHVEVYVTKEVPIKTEAQLKDAMSWLKKFKKEWYGKK